ncbi:MAG: iron-containing alcohol dehydrogenase [Candidatus Brocadiia bacterium]
MAALPRFNTPPQVIIGPGASDLVGEEARRLKARRVLLVTEPGIVRMGVADQVLSSLSKAGVAAATYDKVQPDPTDANVAEGLEIFRRDGCNLVVGVGGGSPIDAAKSIAVMSANPGVIADYMGYHKVPNSGAPVIAIPTTAGTGSEVTKVVVIGDTRRDIKMMCLDLHFLAAAALVDYKLTMSMPKGLTANVGLDSLVHAVEAYISRKAHPLTDVLALAAIRQISGNIRTAWAEPGNESAREAMMLGATMGGMAFSNSSVALVHGMSRPLGALFHLHHGLSNAVLIPAVMAYNAPACGERFADIARAMGLDVAGLGAPEAAQRAVAALVKLNADLQVPRLRDCNIPRDALEKALPKMAADALASGSPANNPRVPTAEEIIELYRQAY